MNKLCYFLQFGQKYLNLKILLFIVFTVNDQEVEILGMRREEGPHSELLCLSEFLMGINISLSENPTISGA